MEVRPGRDELCHGICQSGDIGGVHFDGVGYGVVGGREEQADVGEGVDAREGEGGPGFFQFDVEEEKVGTFVGVVGEERGGDEGVFGFESGERELGVGVELVGVEEDDEVEQTGSREREDAVEEGVVEVDDTGEG